MLHKKNGKDGIHYAEVCTWYGALKYAVAVGDKALIKQLQNKFEPLFTTEANYQPLMNHVDLNMFGCLPFEFYQITKDQRAKNGADCYSKNGDAVTVPTWQS